MRELGIGNWVHACGVMSAEPPIGNWAARPARLHHSGRPRSGEQSLAILGIGYRVMLVMAATS